MPVVGMGGLFFRAKDPEALNTWYREHLNVGGGCSGTDEPPVNQWVWNVSGGPMVFAPFDEGTDYFEPGKSFMINLRVSDLDSLLEQLHAAGIAIITKDEWDSPETGKFARIHDPEGNAIELWEPPAAG